MSSSFLSRHHHNWRIKALEKIDEILDEELQFTGLVSVSQKDFLIIRQLLIYTIKKSLDLVKAFEPTDLACLLIDWFYLN